MKIVIAHEDIILRKKLRQEIEALGHIVVDESFNGLQAYNSYVSHQPDVIFVNLDMPIYNGKQTIERILNYDHDAFCVVLSMTDDNRRVFKLIEQGARHYLNMPFETPIISKLIEDIIKIKDEME